MINSWLNLKYEDKLYSLPDSVREKDPFGGVDIGWIEQMRPFIQEFSKPGDIVLDPFAGLGTTLVASEIEGRRSLGIEVEPIRTKLIEERWLYHGFSLGTFRCLQGDSVSVLRDIAWGESYEKLDLCLSSIPYFDSEWKGSQAGQLYAESSYQEYLNYIKNVLFLLRSIVNDDAYIILMAENIRTESGTLRPIAWDIGKLMNQYFSLYDERVIVYGSQEYVTGLPSEHTNRSHEYVLIAKNTRPTVSVHEACLLLKEMYTSGIEFILYGGFESVLRGNKTKTTDVDILLDNNLENKISALTYFIHQGYDIYLCGKLLGLTDINTQFLTENLHRHFRCISDNAIHQLDLVFLDACEMDKVDVDIKQFPRILNTICLNEEWSVTCLNK